MIRRLFLCGCLALAACGLAAQEEAPAGEGNSTAGKVKQEVKGAAKAVGDKAVEVGHAVRDEAHKAKEGIKSGAHEAKEGIKSTAKKAGPAIKKGAKTVGHGIKSAVKGKGAQEEPPQE
jgi:hypothetical protein